MDFAAIATIVRYAGMIFAGFLVSQGVIAQSMAEAVTGLIVALVAFGWWFFRQYLPAKRDGKNPYQAKPDYDA